MENHINAGCIGTCAIATKMEKWREKIHIIHLWNTINQSMLWSCIPSALRIMNIINLKNTSCLLGLSSVTIPHFFIFCFARDHVAIQFPWAAWVCNPRARCITGQEISQDTSTCWWWGSTFSTPFIPALFYYEMLKITPNSSKLREVQ